MNTLAITENKKTYIGQTFLDSKTMIRVAGLQLNTPSWHQSRVGGKEITPSNVTTKQVLVDEVGEGFISHIISPVHLVGAKTILTLTIDGKVKEYEFTQGVESSKYVFVLSFGSVMSSEVTYFELPFILASAAQGNCLEFKEGFKLEYQCDNVNTSSTNNAKTLHAIYNISNEFDYDVARKENVSEW
ncbi:hypothetical protein [Colwellia sp. E150_009]